MAKDPGDRVFGSLCDRCYGIGVYVFKTFHSLLQQFLLLLFALGGGGGGGQYYAGFLQ